MAVAGWLPQNFSAVLPFYTYSPYYLHPLIRECMPCRVDATAAAAAGAPLKEGKDLVLLRDLLPVPQNNSLPNLSSSSLKNLN